MTEPTESATAPDAAGPRLRPAGEAPAGASGAVTAAEDVDRTQGDPTQDDPLHDDPAPDGLTPDESAPDESTPDESTPDESTPAESAPSSPEDGAVAPLSAAEAHPAGGNPEPADEPAEEPSPGEPADEPSPSEPADEPSPSENADEPSLAEPAGDVAGEADAGTSEPTAEAAGAQQPTGAAHSDTGQARPGKAGPRAPKPGAGPRKDGGGKPRGVPRPPARPATGSPADVKPLPRPPQAPVSAPPPAVHDAQEAAHAAEWGRVDDDGTVWVREAAGERAVGQYPGAAPKEALAYYVVRFLDLQAQVALLEARLPQLSPKEIDQTLGSLETALHEPAAVGDLDGLRSRLDSLKDAARERREKVAAEREAAKAEAATAREAIVRQAEELAAGDPERTQWRPAGERLRELLEEWKQAQRHGPRIDKATEDELWRRFSHARAAFDRSRRQHFSELESRRAQARSAKEELIATAERLSTSTDWAATSGEYRVLMDRWKAAGRAAPREDDALWERFRAAQDAFFAARNAVGAAAEEEFAANLRVKLELLTEAEALVPVKDVNRARTALRSIQDRWEDAGKVPRGEVQHVEGRLRAVEQAVRDAQQTQWARKNPETRARAEGALAQLEATIAGLEADLEAAKAKGDARAIRAAKEALGARQAWLNQLRRTADEVR